jgi:hypothetical protein
MNNEDEVTIHNITIQGSACSWGGCGIWAYKCDQPLTIKDSKFYDNGEGAGFVSGGSNWFLPITNITIVL